MNEENQITTVDTNSKSKYYLPEIPKIEKEKIAEYLMDKHIIKGGLTKEEVEHATELCLALNLNPIKKEIYFAAYGSGDKRQFTPIASYTAYIAKGQQTRLLNGFETTIEEKDGKVFSATCTIHRKDWDRPFQSTVYYDELVKTKDEWENGKKTGKKVVTEFWEKMPRKMLSKCAVVDAFRSCFAGTQELQGLPYIQEELDGDFIDPNKVKSHKQPEAIQENKLNVKALKDYVVKQGLKESDLDKILENYCDEKLNGVMCELSDLPNSDEVRAFISNGIKELKALKEGE
jgi:hypothetical protein